MCPSHKTENLESCGFLRSVYRYMCDFLAENLSFLSHLPLTQSPSLGKNELSSERLLADNPTAVQSLKRHPGEVSSEAFQTFLKERNPLSIWHLLLTWSHQKALQMEHLAPWTRINIFYKPTLWYSGVCVSVLWRLNLQDSLWNFQSRGLSGPVWFKEIPLGVHAWDP